MNISFWVLRIFSMGFLFFAVCIGANPGASQSPFIFLLLVVIGLLGIPLWPIFVFHTVHHLLSGPNPNTAGFRKYDIRTQAIYISTVIWLISIGAFLVLPPVIFLVTLWPIPAFVLGIYHLSKSPRFEPWRKRILIESTISACIIFLGLVLAFTQYPAILRFRLNAPAFQSALLTAPRNTTLIKPIAGFYVREVRDDQSGTYFLLHQNFFFGSGDSHGFAYKPNPNQTPFHKDQLLHNYTLTPTGIPEWYLFKEVSNDWD